MSAGALRPDLTAIRNACLAPFLKTTEVSREVLRLAAYREMLKLQTRKYSLYRLFG